MKATIMFFVTIAAVMLACLATTAHAEVVLVSYTVGDAVVQYSVSGTTWTYQKEFASGTYGGTALDTPLGLAMDSNGYVYIAEEKADGRVLRFDLDGTYDSAITGPSGWNPEALAIGPDGNLYVSDAWGTDKIYKVDLSDDSVGTFIDTTGTGYTLNNPRGIAFASDGNLYVANRSSDEILKFDGSNGAWISDFATPTHPQALSWDASSNRLLAGVNNPPSTDIRSYTLAGVSTDVYDQSTIGSIIEVEAIGGEVYFTAWDENKVYRVTGSTSAEAVVHSNLLRCGRILVIPEPSTLVLLAAGGLGLLLWRRRRRSVK